MKVVIDFGRESIAIRIGIFMTSHLTSLRRLLEEYEGLREPRFASPHDFFSRQRALEEWADRANRIVAALVERYPELDVDGQPALGEHR